MSYKRLSVIKFGKALLETEDLDPVYIMLWEGLDRDLLSKSRLKRFLCSYSMFYHVGVSSKLSYYRGRDFWENAAELALPESKTPRGTERRHFRGDTCLKAINQFEKDYPEGPEFAIRDLIVNCKEAIGPNGVVDFVKHQWYLYGPWIGFKLADLLERLDLAPIQFKIKNLEMYSEPTKGAEIVAKKVLGLEEPNIQEVVKYLKDRFSEYTAPPRHERKVGVQEVETILCKWKSHLNGHYSIGKDTHEIYEALQGWGKLANRFRRVVKESLFSKLEKWEKNNGNN